MSSDSLRLSVLGPLAAWRGEDELDLGSPQQQAVLAALVLRGGNQTDLDELVDGLWGEDPPAAARGTVRTYISRLRRVLDPRDQVGPITSTARGYRLPRSTFAVDLDEFQRLTTEAATAAADEPTTSADLLHRALGLWSGTPLAGLPGPYLEAQRRRLEQLGAAALEERMTADLALGRPAVVLADLAVLIPQNPLRERLRELQVEALWNLGRQADALAAYQDARERLAEDLGIDPGAALRRLQRRILAGESPPEPKGQQERAPSRLPRPVQRPAQLPADPTAFVGRTAELDALQAVLPPAGDDPPAAAVVAVRGMAGVGKTAVAVHWAHKISERYPDGQLYVNLRGFDPSASAVSPGDAVQGFLEGLGVAAHDVPVSLGSQTALFRSLLSDRRMLILLDNARDADQARPLLPGAPGCLVVITSRNPMQGIVATEGARSVTIGVFSPEQSRSLLVDRLGADRVAAEPEAVDRLVARCGGLALALAIVAARAAVNPSFSLGDLAEEVHSAPADLSAFSALDPATDVRSVFSWSYGALGPGAARMFRDLAHHPGPDVGRAAAASTGGVPLREAGLRLGELVAAHLVDEHRPGRYLMHDLVRAYALELVADEVDRQVVTRRILDHYLHTAVGTVELLTPYRRSIATEPAAAGVTPQGFADRDAAVAWYDAERATLLAVLEEAYHRVFDPHVCQLAWALMTMQDLRGRSHDCVFCQRLAIAAARRHGDRWWAAFAHFGLARGLMQLELFAESLEHCAESMRVFEALGERGRLADALVLRAAVSEDTGDWDAASAAREKALTLYRSLDEATGEASVRNNIGDSLLKQGRPDAAVVHLVESRDRYRESGHPFGEAMATANLGRAHADRLDEEAAITEYRRAVVLFAELKQVVQQAEALVDLGSCYWRSGQQEAARGAWLVASSLFEGMDRGDPMLERLRARLHMHEAQDSPQRARQEAHP